MKIDIANANTHLMDEKLGISAARREEIYKFVEQQYNDVMAKGIGIRLVEYYVALADFSNNLAEYTFCMHVFIFNLAGVGSPSDSDKFKN